MASFPRHLRAEGDSAPGRLLLQDIEEDGHRTDGEKGRTSALRSTGMRTRLRTTTKKRPNGQAGGGPRAFGSESILTDQFRAKSARWRASPDIFEQKAIGRLIDFCSKTSRKMAVGRIENKAGRVLCGVRA
eukprot:jgi/Undpi1/289/HiC_scaffold_1.g00285.m1